MNRSITSNAKAASLNREGGCHSIYSNPANGAEIDNRLAQKIRQQLAIKPIR